MEKGFSLFPSKHDSLKLNTIGLSGAGCLGHLKFKVESFDAFKSNKCKYEVKQELI